MSSILALKHLLYKLDNEGVKSALADYFSIKKKELELTVTEKRYKCYQADIMIGERKLCSGFGKNEKEAVNNVQRIALEGVVDTTSAEDLCTVKNILTNPGSIRENESRIEKENRILKKHLHIEAPPHYLLCPLSKNLMSDPVFTADGHTYEREHIETWLRLNLKSPVTGKELVSKMLRPNHVLKQVLLEYQVLKSHFTPKLKPATSSKPFRNLYNTAYGPQFAELDNMLPSEELQVLSLKASQTLQGHFNITI